MNNIILYVGGFGFPSRTASAQRARENARLFKSLGYDVVLMGKYEASEAEEIPTTECRIDGFPCFDIRQPDNARDYPSYIKSIDTIRSVVARYGVENIYSIIAYNYPPRALQALITFARKAKIRIIAECTEWHGWEGPKVARNVLRFFQTEYRMRFLARRAGNIICATQHACSYYDGRNTVALPFVIDANTPKWQSPPRPPGQMQRRFIYAGSPGIGMSKDYLHLVIEAFAKLKQAGHDFEFVIVGLTLEQFLEEVPSFADKVRALGSKIRFLGQLPHDKTIREVCQSDFFVFLRPDNRVSRFGFPTKLAEAFSCGVPTITNDTSDIGLYLHTRKNGFLLGRPDVDELKATLVQTLEISDADLLAMKGACLDENPFHPEYFRESVGDFLKRAR